MPETPGNFDPPDSFATAGPVQPPHDGGKVPVSRGVVVFAKVMLAFVVMVVVYLLVVEVGLRYLDLPGLSRAELDPPALRDATRRRTMGHPYLGYCLTPGWRSEPGAERQCSHNGLGFRGPETTWDKPQGVYRIVCIGGSSTYGHTPSSDETTWTARLQHHLNAELQKRPEWRDAKRRVEVINGGCSGYSTFEMLINLETRLVDFKPDLVLVYEAINDMRCALWKVPPKPDNSHWRDVWPRVEESPIEPYLEGSMTYLLWRSRMTKVRSTVEDLGFWAIVDYDPKEMNPYPKVPLEQVSPVGFRNYRRNLMSIAAVARMHGANVMFGVQGNDKRDFDGRESKAIELAALEQMKRILRSVAEQQGVPLADCAAVLEAAAEREYAEKGETTIFSHEVHMWDPGHDLLARTWTEAILRNDLLK